MEISYNHYALADPRIDDPIQRVRYIGRTVQGLHARFKGHRKSVRDGGRTHRDHWLRQLFSLELQPIIIDLGQGPEGHEQSLIQHWRDLGADLTNRTPGGNGCRGYKWNDEQVANRRRTAREVASRPGWKEKVIQATIEALNTPEMKAKISEGVRRHAAQPGVAEQRREMHREVLSRPDVKAKIYSPANQRKRAERIIETLHSPEMKEKCKSALRAKRSEPGVTEGYSERMREIRKRPEAIEKRLTAYSETFQERRRADPLNTQILAMYQEGLNKAEIARQLGIAYKKVVNRVIRLRGDGFL